MKKQIIIVSAILLTIITAFISTNKFSKLPWSRYDNAQDSLFYGFTFGMEKQAFFDRCWLLNKTMNITQGTHNTSVLLINTTDFVSPVDMNFYPNFCNNKICQMPIYFNYKAWAPWNETMQSQKLIIEVKDLMEKWFGKGFEENRSKNGKILFHKTKGAVRITILTRDEQFVDVMIENKKYLTDDVKK